jgi:WD40 repeat protein
MSISRLKSPDAPPITAVPAREYAFEAYVTHATFDASGEPIFALGDGTLRICAAEAPMAVQAHKGPVLCLAANPLGGVVSGGDDGVLVHTRPGGGNVSLLDIGPAWIENVAISRDGQTLVCTGAREAIVVRVGGQAPTAPRRLPHVSTAAGLALDAKGKRIAVAHYGGVSLWWVGSQTQTPMLLPWRGSHLGVSFSPDGRFVVSTMQENSLHGWRIADTAHFQMNGFPSKVKSISWGPRGKWLITSGSDRGLIWGFEGRQGPIGRDALEIGQAGAPIITCVAAHPFRDFAAMGHADGSIVLAQADGERCAVLRLGDGAAVSAMAWSADGLRLATGSESGFAAVMSFNAEAL